MRLTRLLTWLLVSCAVTGFVEASQTCWDRATGDWSNGSNWTAGEPTGELEAHVDNGGTVTVSNAGEVCWGLYAGETAWNTGNLLMTGGTLEANYEYIGISGASEFGQSGGVNTVAERLYLGFHGSGSGSYTMVGSGELHVGHLYLGLDGTGSMEQSDGVVALAIRYDETLLSGPVHAYGYMYGAWMDLTADVDYSHHIVTTSGVREFSCLALSPVSGYTLTVAVEGEGEVTPNGGVYAPGVEAGLAATAASGWTFVRWDGDASGSSPAVTVDMTSDKSVTAVFERSVSPQHALTVNVVGEGTVRPDGGSFDEGTSVALEAEAADGWVFVGWSGDLSGVQNPAQLSMDGDKTITATFEQAHIDCRLTINVQGQGHVLPEERVFSRGSEVTLTAVPAEGWHFVRWQGEINAKEASVTITLDRDMTTAVVFEEDLDQCVLTVEVLGDGGYVVSENATFIRGTMATVIAYPWQGYGVKSWTGTDDDQTTAGSIEVRMNDDRHVTVEFEIIQENNSPAPVDPNNETNPISPAGGCALVAATYDTPLVSCLPVLRDFRDRYLAANVAGRTVIAAYYRVSPTLAKAVRRDPFCRTIVRMAIPPVAAVIRDLMHPAGPSVEGLELSRTELGHSTASVRQPM